MDIHYNEFDRKIIIDVQLCKASNVANDSWQRIGVTPFALACYFWQGVYSLHKTPSEVFEAIMTNWDKAPLYWGDSPISILTWNALFNGNSISMNEWKQILFPLCYIDEIYTNITSPNTKTACYFMSFGASKRSYDLMLCTKEAYKKTIIDRTSTKITAYRYGSIINVDNIFEGLRKDVTCVIFPFESLGI